MDNPADSDFVEYNDDEVRYYLHLYGDSTDEPQPSEEPETMKVEPGNFTESEFDVISSLSGNSSLPTPAAAGSASPNTAPRGSGSGVQIKTEVKQENVQ